MTGGVTRAAFGVWGGTAVVAVTSAAALPAAEGVARSVLAATDAACSRWRPDSEVRRLAARGGRWQPVSEVLAEVVTAAFRAARATDGLVDPTVAAGEPAGDRIDAPAAGCGRVGWDQPRRRMRVPAGMVLDFGAIGKAWVADEAASRIAAELGVGALVSVGGDLAVAGPAPDDGWRVRVGDDHERAAPGDPVVTVAEGGLATSGTARRMWRAGRRSMHHILDPRTGQPAEVVWRTASVAAGSCVDANAASTAAIILGREAPGWLSDNGLPARLVHRDGRVRVLGGWPAERAAQAVPAAAAVGT